MARKVKKTKAELEKIRAANKKVRDTINKRFTKKTSNTTQGKSETQGEGKSTFDLIGDAVQFTKDLLDLKDPKKKKKGK